MFRSRALRLSLVVAALAACSPDKPGGPANPIASRLTEAADDYAARDDYRAASALYSASAMVRAGGRISSVVMNVDTAPRTFNAVGLRVSLTRAACEQIKTMLADSYGDVSPDSPGDLEDFAYDPCRPQQSLIAWEGENMSRIVLVQGDTGTSVTDVETFDFSFFGELYDRENNTDWFLRSGHMSAAMVGGASPCRAAAPEPGVTFTCKLVTLTQSFDMLLEEWPSFDDGGDSVVVVVRPRRVHADVADTAVWGDTSYVWEPSATHTIEMPSRTVSGLWMEITKFDFNDMVSYSLQKSRLPSMRRARFR